jgi:hypothetical protein
MISCARTDSRSFVELEQIGFAELQNTTRPGAAAGSGDLACGLRQMTTLMSRRHHR